MTPLARRALTRLHRPTGFDQDHASPPPCSRRRMRDMVVLNFTLTPEAASKVHDLLVCLGKFSETVAIEARRERVGVPESYLSLSSHIQI